MSAITLTIFMIYLYDMRGAHEDVSNTRLCIYETCVRETNIIHTFNSGTARRRNEYIALY